MSARKTAYLAHRWIGLLVSLQLLAWSAGGFTFSILHIESVRGERDIATPPFEPLTADALAVLPGEPRNALNEALPAGSPPVGSIALADRGLGPFWEVRATDGSLITRLDPTTGHAPGPISPADAAALALRDFAPDAPIIETRHIAAAPPTEYREGPLPAYRVALDHPAHPHIYIEAGAGQVTARRNSRWRIFDFFWMLHTMDYTGRDNFNHPLLTTFSILAIATSASGLGLWGWRTAGRFRSRRRG